MDNQRHTDRRGNVAAYFLAAVLTPGNMADGFHHERERNVAVRVSSRPENPAAGSADRILTIDGEPVAWSEDLLPAPGSPAPEKPRETRAHHLDRLDLLSGRAGRDEGPPERMADLLNYLCEIFPLRTF